MFGALQSAPSAGRPWRSTLRRGHRRASEHVGDVAFDVCQFSVVEHAFEDVETAARIGLEDRGIELALRVEADRAAIAERHARGVRLRSR